MTKLCKPSEELSELGLGYKHAPAFLTGAAGDTSPTPG